jgi:hypothetical protein
VDLGHHLQGCNIEQVVSRLAMVGNGFHFNDSKYGDDDLTVGSIQPFQLFLIVLELLEHGGGVMPELAYMIDESHNLKDPLEELIQATDQVQVSIAQALLVDRDELHQVQQDNDPARATEIVQRAYRSDVRPIVAEARRRSRAALAPLETYRALRYRAAVIKERGTGMRANASGIRPKRAARWRRAEPAESRGGSPDRMSIARAQVADRWDEAHAAGLCELDLLVYRSNLLGSDLRITNFGGGNTSAKLAAADPLSGERVDVLWVKGSGGDLGSIGSDGFASLYLDRLLALEARYRGREHEDEMASLLGHCVFDANPRRRASTRRSTPTCRSRTWTTCTRTR